MDLRSTIAASTPTGSPLGSLAGVALAGILLGVLLSASGCAVAPVVLPLATGLGSAAYGEYDSGEYVVVIQAVRRDCELAVWQSSQRLRLAIQRWQPDGGETAIELRNVRGDRFKIRIAAVGLTRTALYIRAGFWGDDLCSRQLACDIEAAALRIQGAGRAVRAR